MKHDSLVEKVLERFRHLQTESEKGWLEDTGEEPLHYVCCRVEKGPPAEESIVRQCSRCNEDVWVQQNKEYLADVSILVCTACITEEEQKELKEYLAKGFEE